MGSVIVKSTLQLSLHSTELTRFPLILYLHLFVLNWSLQEQFHFGNWYWQRFSHHKRNTYISSSINFLEAHCTQYRIRLGTRHLYDIYFFCLGLYLLVFDFTVLSKENVAGFVTVWGNMLLKFRFSLAWGDIFQGVLLPTYYELFSISINLEPDCFDHTNRQYLQYVQTFITFIYNLNLYW